MQGYEEIDRESFGEYLLRGIVESGMCKPALVGEAHVEVKEMIINTGLSEDDVCVFWSGNAEEQLEALVLDYVNQIASKELASKICQVLINE